MSEWTIEGRKLKLVEGNIVTLDVDAIVNAANKSLILGGGVAGAIRKFGGPSIQEECNAIGPIEVGEAVITGAGNLKADYVIHAVGPVYGEGNEDIKLANATLNSLKIAHKKRIKSIAFPAISTGIFHFPIKRCAEIMMKVTIDFLKESKHPEEIILCLYGERAYSIFQGTFERMTGQ
ncbi:MAG: macro domain-containing protein [Candidatus Aminicenantes bacterium]|nr:MAG: macro domain-containing protein [Candidatus Aminicenantes bacterium]